MAFVQNIFNLLRT